MEREELRMCAVGPNQEHPINTLGVVEAALWEVTEVSEFTA